MSELPQTLKEDFAELDRLEGQYLVTNFIVEVVDWKDLSPRKGRQCGFCTGKEVAEEMKTIMEAFKPMITLSKVILDMTFKFLR